MRHHKCPPKHGLMRMLALRPVLWPCATRTSNQRLLAGARGRRREFCDHGYSRLDHLGEKQSLPACRWFLFLEWMEMNVSLKKLGLDPATERSQAWQDHSERFPIVRVVGDVVHLYSPSSVGGEHLMSMTCVDVHVLIKKLKLAQQALRVRTSNLMALDAD